MHRTPTIPPARTNTHILRAACLLALCSTAADAQFGVTSALHHPVEIMKKDHARVSAEALLDRTDTIDTQRGTAPFACPAGATQQDLINGPAFVGFASCGVFNPIDNIIPVFHVTLNTMCVRGDYRVSFSSFPADICTGIGIDADALVGWSFKLFGVDALGMPTGAPIYAASTDPPLSNLTMQRFQFGETYDNTPGGRPIETHHLTFTGAPVMEPATCYWFGICWDPTVNANPALADCTWRWAAGKGGAGDGFIIFDNNPADDVYGFCSLLPGDFDWIVDFQAFIPNPIFPCLDASLSAPPTNETCANPIALACDAETNFCPLLANPNIDSLNDPPISCLSGGAGADFLYFTTWYTVQPTSSRIKIEMCQGFNDGWDAAFAVYRENDHADICAELGASGAAGLVPLTELACSDNDCGNDPWTCLSGLTPGETLYIMVGSTDNQNIGEIHFTITCENVPAPPNDDCLNAANIVFSFIGTATFLGQDTTCDNLDPFAVACGGTVNGNSPGLWYLLVGDGNEHTVTTCLLTPGDPDFDSQINVYCGTCDSGLVCITGNNDNFCGLLSEVTFCTENGRNYYVFVHGFFSRGSYELNFIRGFACDPPGNPDCAAGPRCDGDANGDNVVDVNDISYVLFRLGGLLPNGDVNGDGMIDVNDISYVLFRLGNPCP